MDVHNIYFRNWFNMLEKKIDAISCAVQLFIFKAAKHTTWICTILSQSSSLYGGMCNLDYLEIQIVLYVTYTILWYR